VLYNRASFLLPTDQARQLLRVARTLAGFCVEMELRADRQSMLPLRFPQGAADSEQPEAGADKDEVSTDDA
jgi:hypothetical protein